LESEALGIPLFGERGAYIENLNAGTKLSIIDLLRENLLNGTG
jgi:hypothetical protein